LSFTQFIQAGQPVQAKLAPTDPAASLSVLPARHCLRFNQTDIGLNLVAIDFLPGAVVHKKITFPVLHTSSKIFTQPTC
jgi:hypothetical protein